MTLPALYCVKVGRQEGKETGVMSKYNIKIKKAEEAGRKMATCTLFFTGKQAETEEIFSVCTEDFQ